MYHYIKENELYKLIDDETKEVLYEGKEVSICFDSEFGTLLRHGSPELVHNYYDRTITSYNNSGLADIAAVITLIASDKWNVDDLNKCIDITGYLCRMFPRRVS